MDLKVTHQKPTVSEYNELRKLAGWPTFEPDLVEEALSRSLFSVVIHDADGVIVAMGRILGDKTIYLHIQDVIVRPQFQRRGIGKLIMEELLNYVGTVGRPHTNVGLMCSKGREEFYKSFGFSERPNEKFGAGMIKILH